MESEQNPVLDMMERRDRERKLANEKNQRERKQKSELEGVDYFDSVFDKKVLEIQTRLDALDPSSDSGHMQEEFTSIAKDLQELQRYFTSSTIFLSDHKIQRCQNIINQLVTKSDETKTRIAPKKKFGFKNKSTVASKPEVKVDETIKDEVLKKEFIWTLTQKLNEV